MNPDAHDLLPLIDRYHERLKRFVIVTVIDAWAAGDIVQETFLRAHRKIHTLRDERRVSAWLFQVAHRLCVDIFVRGPGGLRVRSPIPRP
jgi:RNA polymerase sigma-70 factor (ECF subfamily)